MKQFQFGYKTYEQFRNELTKIRQWQNARIVSKIVLQVYSVELESSVFRKMFAAIDEILPDAIYLGCSTNGNIIDGKIVRIDDMTGKSKEEREKEEKKREEEESI